VSAQSHDAERYRAALGSGHPNAFRGAWLAELPEGESQVALAGGPEREPVLGPVSDELHLMAEQVGVAGARGDIEGLVAGARALARAGHVRAAADACLDALSVAPADPEVHRMLAAIYRRRGWERAALVKLEIVDRYQRAVDDPAELDRRADDAIVSGDIDGLLRVVTAHAEQGRIATALDLAFTALGSSPGDPRLHLAIARLHLALGWRRQAIEEVARLARLVEVTDDEGGREAVADFVNGRLRPRDAPAASAR
jgi:tetratricopeptide (TPR) repeat protein